MLLCKFLIGKTEQLRKAFSIHIIVKMDVVSIDNRIFGKILAAVKVALIVGTEKQGEDLINYLMGQFEDNPAGIWETNIFGKFMHDLVNEGLSSNWSQCP